MADLTKAQIDALIELNRSALSTALASPKPNYRIGGKTVNFADYIEILTKNLNALRGITAGIPAESVVDFDYDVTELGDDNTQYEGD